MRPQSSAIEIDAPTERVWALIAHYEHWPEWGTSIRSVDPASGGVEPGETGRVLTIVGLWLPFEITQVREGSFWAWTVAGIDATDHRVEPSPGGSHVTFTAPEWAPFYRPVLAASLRRLRRLAERSARPR